jgi:hypothetical protein
VTAKPVAQVQLLGSFAMSLRPQTAGPRPRLSAKRLVELVFLSPKRRIFKRGCLRHTFRRPGPPSVYERHVNALSAARAVLAGRLTDGAAGVLCTDRTRWS